MYVLVGGLERKLLSATYTRPVSLSVNCPPPQLMRRMLLGSMAVVVVVDVVAEVVAVVVVIVVVVVVTVVVVVEVVVDVVLIVVVVAVVVVVVAVVVVVVVVDVLDVVSSMTSSRIKTPLTKAFCLVETNASVILPGASLVTLMARDVGRLMPPAVAKTSKLEARILPSMITSKMRLLEEVTKSSAKKSATS